VTAKGVFLLFNKQWTKHNLSQNWSMAVCLLDQRHLAENLTFEAERKDWAKSRFIRLIPRWVSHLKLVWPFTKQLLVFQELRFKITSLSQAL